MATIEGKLVIGYVLMVKGDAEAKDAVGGSRPLQVGDPIYANDVIATADASSILIEFTDGSRLDLGRSSTALLNDDVFNPNLDVDPSELTASIDAIQQAILAGEDPTDVSEATAAGNPSSAGGGPSEAASVAPVIELSGMQATPDSGFETEGLEFNFPEGDEELLFINPDNGSTSGTGGSTTPSVNTVLVSIEGPASVVEGETAVAYAVTLDENVPAGNSVTVNLGYTGTATDGTDYNGVASVVIAGGTNSTTFNIATIDDAIADNGESFVITIGSIVDTDSSFDNIVADATANAVTTTISDQVGSDTPPTAVDTTLVSISGPATVVEGESTTNYTVSLSNAVPTGNSVTVNLSYTGTATDGTDYTGVASVVIAGGTSSTTFNLATIDDAFADNGETIIIDIDSITDTNTSFENIIEDVAANQVTTTISDQTGSDTPPTAVDTTLVSIAGPATVVEGETTTNYTVSLSNAVPAGNSVTVNLSYTGTATDGTDYTGVASVVIAGGTSSTTFNLATIDDAFADNGETIIIDIDSITDTNTSFENIIEDTAANQVTTTISDQTGSDTPPTAVDTTLVSIAGPATVVEGESTTNYTVSLSNAVPTGNSVTVNLSYTGTATDGTDYTGVASVVIAGGTSSTTFNLATIDDAFADNGETIIIDIDSIVDTNTSFENIIEDTAANQVTTTISDQTGSDTPPTAVDTTLVSIAGPATVVEGESTTNYTVSLSNAVPTGNSVTVNLSYTGTATDGTDYTGVASVVIAGGTSSTTFNLATIDDAFADNGETIIIDIDSIVDTDTSFENIIEDTAANQVTTTISDQTGSDNPPGSEDTVLVSITGPGSVVEGDVTTNYTVSLGQTVPAGNSVTVNLAYSGTAADGTDYNSVASVVIAGGTNSTTFTLATIDDLLSEGIENIVIDIDSIVDTNSSFENIVENTAANQVTTAIADNDSPVLTVDNVTVNEDAGTATFTVTLSLATSNPFTVNYALTDGTATGGGVDYTSTGGVLNFAGTAAETQTITVPITNDIFSEGNETFTVSLSASDPLVDDSDTAIGTIVDNNDATTLTLNDVTVNEGVGTATIDATLSNAAGVAFTVTLSNGATISFAAGATTATSTAFAIQGDDVIIDAETINVSVTNAGAHNFENLITTDTATVTINDTIDTVTVDLSATATAAEGTTGSITYTASLTGGTAGNPITVTLANGEVITIAAGAASGSVTINAPSDDAIIDAGPLTNSIASAVEGAGAGQLENLALAGDTSVTTSITDTIDDTVLTLNDVSVLVLPPSVRL